MNEMILLLVAKFLMFCALAVDGYIIYGSFKLKENFEGICMSGIACMIFIMFCF